MRLLAFDTATGATTVAFFDTGTGAEYEARDDPAPGGRPGHARKLLTLCEQVLGKADASWRDLDRLAVGVGPGTFTGLRIGIASAHALSQATAIPLVGVSTLESLMLGAGSGGLDEGDMGEDSSVTGPVVLAVIDARRGEAFVAGAGLGPSVVKPNALQQLVKPGMLAVGDGALKFREILTGAGATVPSADSPLHLVNARQHCRLAAAMTPGLPTDVQPQYLRIPDAELAHGS